jgi:hypothetical protein
VIRREQGIDVVITGGIGSLAMFQDLAYEKIDVRGVTVVLRRIDALPVWLQEQQYAAIRGQLQNFPSIKAGLLVQRGVPQKAAVFQGRFQSEGI